MGSAERRRRRRKFRWNSKVPTASELLAYEAEETRRTKKDPGFEEGPRRTKKDPGFEEGPRRTKKDPDFEEGPRRTKEDPDFEDCGEVPLVERGGEIIFNIFKMENYSQISRSRYH